MVSPKSRGLFHKAIIQSGYTLPDLPRENALEKGRLLAEHFAATGQRRTAGDSRGGILVADRAAEYRTGTDRRRCGVTATDAGGVFLPAASTRCR